MGEWHEAILSVFRNLRAASAVELMGIGVNARSDVGSGGGLLVWWVEVGGWGVVVGGGFVGLILKVNYFGCCWNGVKMRWGLLAGI